MRFPPRWLARNSWTYELLPGSDSVAQKHRARRSWSTRRPVAWVAAAVLFLGFLSLGLRLCYGSSWTSYISFFRGDELPPLYSRFHEAELRLPQHDVERKLYSGEKYIYMANHVHASGWGNVMQELLMNHYLAYRAGRSFVFDNFTWNDDGSLYSYFNGKPIPSRIPLSAHIQGPTAGGVFITDPAAPRAVMKEFFDEICPHPTIIRNDDIIRSLGRESTAEVMIEKWVEVLRATDDRCVEVARGSWQIFDIFIFGSRGRLLDVWPSFSRSPIVTEFAWSPLIELAFDANREIFAPSATAEPFLLASPFTGNNAERYTPIPGLLALHIRRGDFEEHCRKLPSWGSSYVGYASFPEFGDRLYIPPGAEPEERAEIYRRHCFPEIDEIVSKVEEVHASEAGRGLRHVFVMTNGSREWLAQLEAALMRSGIWTSVTSSRDLLLNAEQEYVKQAVDMLIGHRSQVFIGNGFSSLTGQVNMLRMAYGFPPETNRFW